MTTLTTLEIYMYMNINVKLCHYLSSVPRGLEEVDRLAGRSREKTGLGAGDLQRARQDQSPTGQTQGTVGNYRAHFNASVEKNYNFLSSPPFFCVQEFQKALGSKQPVYDTTVRSGKAMRDKAQLPADTQKLDHLVGEVRDKWDTVCGKSVER